MTAPRALVTGGSQGLGRAFCEALLSRGFDVCSVDRAQGAGMEGTSHLTCDLADRDALDRLLETLAAGPAFDLVIFNAGISATGKFEALPPEAFETVIRVNAEAPMVMASAMVKSGSVTRGGKLVFVSSLSHFTGYPGASAYAASKDAVAVYAKSIRKPLMKSHGIGVSCAYPGPLKTDHAARHAPAGADEARRMEPQDAARLILEGVANGKAEIFPGSGARLFALLGRLAPGPVTAAMRRIIYDKLTGEVW